MQRWEEADMVQPKLHTMYSNGTMALPIGHAYRLMADHRAINESVDLVRKTDAGS